jgi:hypothetical protein
MELMEWPHPRSLLGILARMPDPRRRQGRIYRLYSILGMLILAAINGQSSLRGMWVWADAHWEWIADGLGFTDVGRLPSLSNVWYVLTNLDVKDLERVLREWDGDWLEGEEAGWSMDGKVLRGSKRPAEPALTLVCMVAHQLKGVLAEQPVCQGGEVKAALELLRRVPLEGRVVTMDAGLLQREVVRTIREGGGDFVGIVKQNHGQMKWAIDKWIEDPFSPPGQGTTTGLCEGRKATRED